MEAFSTWDDYVHYLRQILGKEVKKISVVDWTSVSQEDLENDTFRDGDPFYIVGPQESWGDFQKTASFQAICHCRNWQGNTIPSCIPKESGYPIMSGICINIANPEQYNYLGGRACIAQGADWHPLTVYFFCP